MYLSPWSLNSGQKAPYLENSVKEPNNTNTWRVKDTGTNEQLIPAIQDFGYFLRSILRYLFKRRYLINNFYLSLSTTCCPPHNSRKPHIESRSNLIKKKIWKKNYKRKKKKENLLAQRLESRGDISAPSMSRFLSVLLGGKNYTYTAAAHLCIKRN